jgi:FkbM family methyltransferase
MAEPLTEAALAVPNDGTVRVCLPESDDPIAQELRAGSYRLPAAGRLVFDLVGSGSRLLDLGAHLGTVALPAAAKGAAVLAVEASPRNAQCLVESAHRNGFSAFEVRNVAVGDQAGHVRFREEGPYGRVAASDDAAGIDVEMQSAAAILDELHWDRVDVIKIDVEGYELRVVDGLRSVLHAPDLPTIVFEANRHVLAPHGVEPGDVITAFAGLGYETYFVADDALVPVDPHTFQPETVADYLAISSDRDKPWPVRDRASNDDLATRIAAEARSALPEARTALAKALTVAPRALLAHREVEGALEALVIDVDDDVVAAAAWWPAWRYARAAREGAVAVIVDGWRGMADSVHALAPNA